MNNKPTILFDMDGTTFDFRTPLYDLIQKEKTLPEYVRKTLSDITNWTKVWLHELFDPAEFDISQIKQNIGKLHRNETFFENLQLYPWMKGLLQELSTDYNIKFCTKPSIDDEAKSESAKRTAIIRELGVSRSESMTTTHDKTETRGRILFDDADKIIWSHKPERLRVIVDQPHNQWIPGTRVYHDSLEEWKPVIIQKLLWL